MEGELLDWGKVELLVGTPAVAPESALVVAPGLALVGAPEVTLVVALEVAPAAARSGWPQGSERGQRSSVVWWRGQG